MALPSSPEGGRRRLRLGLVVDAPAVPRWVTRAVELARRSTPTDVDLLVLADPGAAERPRRPLLRRLYDRLDAHWFHLDMEATTAVRPDEVAGWNPRVIPMSQLNGEGSFDALLWLAKSAPPERLVHAARYGIWRWRFGKAGAKSALEPSFGTVLADSPIIEARLTAVVDGGEEHELASSVNNAVRFSARRTESAVSWQAARLLARAVSGIQAGEATAAATNDPTPRSRDTRLATGLVDLGMRYVRHRLKNARRLEKWTLAFHRGAPGEPGPAIVPGQYVDLLPPRDRDWADPFPCRHEGVDWIFFEEFQYTRGIGHLSVAPLGTQHFTAKPHPIIIEDFHLSYPFVFQHEGEHYLMPETAERRCIQLYRAVRFPFEWKRDRVVMHGTAVIDPTLIQIEGRWWLFCCEIDDASQPWGELHVFFGDSPFGPWTAHRRNPVVADVRHARPAGRIFRAGGAWYRPSQDCSVAYGHALSLRRIDVLTPEDFQETEVARLDPTWADDLCGVHTLNASDNLTLIDVRRRVWRPR